MSSSTTVRRSVAIPFGLVKEVTSLAPRELRENFNRLVITALREFAKELRARRFRQEMAAMAQDPQVRAASASISNTFAAADGDGLGRLP